MTVRLALPAASAATTLTVAPGAPDAAGNTSGCSAHEGATFTCVTLRDAIAFANAGLAGGNPTVQLAAGTYTLANTQLITTVPMTITGTGNSGAHASASVRVPVIVKLSQVAQARSTWAETKTTSGPPAGTTFRYTLNTRATVTLTFSHQKTRRAAGKLTGPGRVGKHTVAFKGKVGRHKLAPGRYTVTITARTPTSTSAKTLAFTIV